ncbi:hypothetical protein M5689_019935 [Euphorbia peplus]|nr:hypothetical protein M5689_019935 [Euphorbia peplus]
MADAPPPPMAIDGSHIDTALSSSSHLTHQELMARRSRRLKQLSKIYRAHYWGLMEDLKSKYKEYYWKYGKSPFREDDKKRKRSNDEDNCNNGIGDSNGKLGLGLGSEEQVEGDYDPRNCVVGGCKGTAMVLTKFCHQHILLDSKQKLYKSCNFVVKSTQSRPFLCGKPVLRSTVPTLCPPHFQKAELYVARDLRKAGLTNVSSPSKIAPKFHNIVSEFVHQIQSKRRAALKENGSKEIKR